MYKLLIVTKFNGNVATSIAEFSTQELAERGGQCLVSVNDDAIWQELNITIFKLYR